MRPSVIALSIFVVLSSTVVSAGGVDSTGGCPFGYSPYDASKDSCVGLNDSDHLKVPSPKFTLECSSIEAVSLVLNSPHSNYPADVNNVLSRVNDRRQAEATVSCLSRALSAKIVGTRTFGHDDEKTRKLALDSMIRLGEKYSLSNPLTPSGDVGK